MTIDERQLLNARIGELHHWAMVRIRNFTYTPLPDEPDRRDEINALADLLHNLPRYMVGHDEHAIDSPAELRDAVVAHVKRFYPDTDPELHHCVQLLDMDDEQFLQRYRDHQWGNLDQLHTAPIGSA